MEPDRDWSSYHFHQNSMTTGDYNPDDHQSMDNLSIGLDDPPPPRIDHNVPTNARRRINAPMVQEQAFVNELASASSGYPITPGSSQIQTWYTDPTVYTSYTSSSVGESSSQYQHNTHQDEAPIDPSLSRTNPYAFLGSGLPNPSRPSYLNIPASNDVSTVEPTLSGLNADETISPPSASVRPGPDPRRVATSHNLGVPSQGAQFTVNDDPLRDVRDVVMRRLGQNPTWQRVFQARPDLYADLYADLDEILAAPTAAPTRVNGMQIPPLPPPPPDSVPIRTQRRKPGVAYRCRHRECGQDEECGVTAVSKQSFRRHVETQHYPQYDYHCGVQNCTAFWEPRLHRPDKLLNHYPEAHGLGRPSPSIIEAYRRENLCPPFCPLCRENVGDWEEFYACFLKHCKEAPKASASRDSHRRGNRRRDRDNSDNGNFNGGTSNGGFVSQQGYGHFGNAGDASNPWSSGSDGYQQSRSPQQGGCNQHSNRPQPDPSNLQDQPTSPGSRSHCKSCQHFQICSSCCKSPPSTLFCHACPDTQRALAIQAGVLHAGPSRELLPQTGQTLGVADHAGTNAQAFYDMSSSIPTMAAANPSLYGALPQGPPRLNMRPEQQAQSHGLHSGTDTQQSPISSEQSLMVGAARDVQAVGISELNIEPFISDPKSKKAQTSDNWSGVLTLRGSSSTGVNIAAPLLIGPLSQSKVNPSSMCQCPCRSSSQGTYFVRSRMDIAPGRAIEMDFKMTPEARPGLGHPLRSRIHVVIKMLRLRSSVAKSANGKHKQESRAVLTETREVPLELIEAVGPFEEEEKKIELIFDLDLQSSLKNLSRWTRLPTGNPFSDLSIQDQYRVFVFFMRCMLFVLFVIASLARAQDYDYNSNPCLVKRRPGQPQDHLYQVGYYDYDTRNPHMIY